MCEFARYYRFASNVIADLSVCDIGDRGSLATMVSTVIVRLMQAETRLEMAPREAEVSRVKTALNTGSYRISKRSSVSLNCIGDNCITLSHICLMAGQSFQPGTICPVTYMDPRCGFALVEREIFLFF